MLHGAFVPTAEGIAVCITVFAWNRRMAVCLVIIGIGVAMTFNVVARCFNTLMESAALDITLKVLGRPIPAIAILRCCQGSLSVRSGGICLDSLTHEPQ